MKVRPAEIENSAEIAEIYNFYVLNGHQTFETEPVSVREMQKRVAEILENYPFLVCRDKDKTIGYAYAARYKTRQAYRFLAEVSVYVKNEKAGKGVGTALYENLFACLESTDIHAVVAGISLPNEASVRLHEKFGFEKAAHFREVGFKHERWIDVGYWQKMM